MREIKFRAWDKVNGMFRKQEMIGEPTISKSDLSKGHIVFVNDIFKDKEFDWMQYTGLKDKNGVEVYEGDIVKCTRGCPHEVIFKLEHGGNVMRGMPTFYLSGLNEGYQWMGCEEVIGNVYENRELLEVNENV